MGLKAALCFANSLYLKINVDYEIEVKKIQKERKNFNNSKNGKHVPEVYKMPDMVNKWSA